MPERIEDILKPDKHNLDREWERQPNLLYKYDKKLADAQQDLDEKEAYAELVRAELFLNMRENPDEYDLIKATDAMVTAAIQTQSKYRAAKRGIIQARHRVSVLKGIVFSLQQKRHALDNLTQLHFGEYFARKRKDETLDRVERVGKRVRKRRQS